VLAYLEAVAEEEVRLPAVVVGEVDLVDGDVLEGAGS
jgi:hypothetical protein